MSFRPTSITGECAVQQIILAKIESSLRPFDVDFREAILHSKALPRKISNTLYTALFLSRSVTSARLTQQWTGVPSSILLAVADYDGGPLTEQAFRERAIRLKNDPRFRSVMEAKNTEELLRHITFCGVWDRLEAAGYAEFIRDNDLFELDSPMRD
jgi:hypothetical protein